VTSSDSLKIGDVARLTGFSVDTVRFYEKSGLLGRVARRPSGVRAYDPNVVRRLNFIRQAARLGFSLTEIRGLLALRVSSRTTCETVRSRTLAKLADVDARLANLTRMRAALERLAATCATATGADPCPFLDALEAAKPVVVGD